MSKIFDALMNAQEHHNDGLEGSRVVPRHIRKSRTDGQTPLLRNHIQIYSHLRQEIIKALPDYGPRALLFVSAIDGEGSQEVIIDFARVLVSLGEAVLLVDADLRLPSLHSILGIIQTPGIADLAAGRNELKEVIHPTNMSEFSVIPCGEVSTPSFSMTELTRVYYSIDVMRAFADWVILSAPPVSINQDGLSLAGMVDGIIIVIRAEKTRRKVVQNTKSLLEKAGANVIGAVLNDRKHHIPSWLCRRL
jgi:capsular exopolysaccharide synthesis family protein